MYYKVVRINLQSAVNKAFDLNLNVQYIVGKFVQPKIKQAPLLVFNDIDRAKKFMRQNSGAGPHRLFECEIVESKRKWGWLCDHDKETFFKALKNKKAWTHLVDPTEFPQGTVFADAVKLTKEIVQ
ncbi:MAG: hypothetical protein KDD03_13205 [Gelidibacter sp.]|nr:hypothetical protein [Gelidibacter sp.]